MLQGSPIVMAAALTYKVTVPTVMRVEGLALMVTDVVKASVSARQVQ